MRLRKAHDKVTEIGVRMGLNQYLVDAGKRNYTNAFYKNFIQGRSVSEVAAACLYAACRTDGKAPYLLIDFSDTV